MFSVVFVFVFVFANVMQLAASQNMLAGANLELFPSTECFVQESPDQVLVTGSEEDDEGDGDRKTVRRLDEEDGNGRNARQRKLNYSTKVFEGVPIIVKGDGIFTKETYNALCEQTRKKTNCFEAIYTTETF